MPRRRSRRRRSITRGPACPSTSTSDFGRECDGASALLGRALGRVREGSTDGSRAGRGPSEPRRDRRTVPEHPQWFCIGRFGPGPISTIAAPDGELGLARQPKRHCPMHATVRASSPVALAGSLSRCMEAVAQTTREHGASISRGTTLVTRSRTREFSGNAHTTGGSSGGNFFHPSRRNPFWELCATASMDKGSDGAAVAVAQLEQRPELLSPDSSPLRARGLHRQPRPERAGERWNYVDRPSCSARRPPALDRAS